MPEVDVRIKTTDQGSAKMRNFGSEVDNLNKRVEGSRAAWGKYTMALGAVAGVIGGVAVAGKAMMAALGEGAQLQLAQSRFENLAASIGTTADALTKEMGAATQGMMSQAQMVSSATDIISLGLADTSEETIRLSNLVGQLGWDMQVLTLTLANDSMMRLDALGLSVEGVTAKMKALQATGLSKGEAFDLAVIEAGEEKLELLGSAADTSAGKIQQLSVMWQDAVTAFKLEFAEGVTAQLAAVSEAVQQAAPGFQQGMTELGNIGGRIMGDVMAEGAAIGMKSLNQQMIDQLRTAGVSIVDIQRTTAQATADMPLFGGGAADLEYYSLVNEALREQYAVILNLGSVSEDWVNIQAAMPGQSDRVVTAAEREAAAWEYGISVMNEYKDANGAVNVQLRGYWERGRQAANVNREIAETTGYTVYELAQMGVTAEDVAAQNAAAAEESARAYEEMARRSGQAFQAALGQVAGFKMPDAGPLVTPARDFAVTTRVSGPSENEGKLLEQYTDLAERAAEELDNLRNGIGTYGMTQEEVNKKIDAAAGELAHYQALMGTIPPVVESSSRAHRDMLVNVDAATQILYDQAAAAGADAPTLAALGVATGVLTEEQAKAAITAAAVTEKARFYGEAVANGTLSVDAAVIGLQNYVGYLNGETVPATGAATEAVIGLKDEAQAYADGSPYTARVEVDNSAAMRSIDQARSALESYGYSSYTAYIDAVTPTVPGQASGGQMVGNAPYVVGEAGPELFVPWTNGAVVPNHALGGATTSTVNITMQFYGATDAENVRRAGEDVGAELARLFQQQGVRY